MSIELYFSNQLEQLGQKLSDNLREEQNRRSNLFFKSNIIVPNSNLKKWLQMNIANNIGIAINLEFVFLEEGLWNMLEILDNADHEEPKELLKGEIRQLIILYMLLDIKNEHDDISLISNYLLDNNKNKKDDYANRIWQLSKKLAYYFREYEYHRPEMINSWHTKWTKTSKVDDMELCQSYIYNKLFHVEKGLCRDINGSQFLTLTQYAHKVFDGKNKNFATSKIEKYKKNVHVFGLSQISIFHQNLIAKLSKYFKIYIYAFNPCFEFWEDVETLGEKRWRLMKNLKTLKVSEVENKAGELEHSDNLLLQWWGKPGRENIRLISELTDYNFNELFSLNQSKELKDDTVLERLQRNILLRSPTDDKRYVPLRQDCSLQIVACPGLYYEIETVYNSIIYNMETDKKLNLTDIAILVPDIRKYKAGITSVFDRKPMHIPYNLCDSSAEKESVFGQAVINLLKIVEGTFSRKEIFSLIFNPCFLNRFNLNRKEVQVWLDWVDALNIFHSFDSNDKKMHGYLENSMYTWQHGIRRLRLARIMNKSRDIQTFGEFNDYFGVVPFDTFGIADLDMLEKFCEIIESLFIKTQNLKWKKFSCKEWTEKIISLIDSFLSIPEEHSSEEKVRKILFDCIRNLEMIDKLISSNLDANGEEDNDLFYLEIALIIEFIKEKLGSIPSGYGSYLTGGVTISEMQPMRPIPFKVVYVIGMKEGEFPGRASQSCLDLRLKRRKIGDISSPETNCYMFLEILVSTQKKLYLTFISKNLQNDEEFIPCSIVHQLKQYVESEILHENEYFEIIDIPIKRSDINYFTTNNISKVSDVLINYCEADRISFYTENGLLGEAKQKLNENEQRRLERFNLNLEMDDTTPEPNPKIEIVTLQQLKQFLLNSCEASLKKHLHIFDDQRNDKSLIENEPFFSEFPLNYDLIKNSMEFCVNHSLQTNSKELETETLSFLKNYYRYNLLIGMTPEADFSVIDERKFEKALNEYIPGLLSYCEQFGSSLKWYKCISLGKNKLRDVNIKRFGNVLEFKPLQLEVNINTENKSLTRQQIEVHGALPIIWENSFGWNCLVLTTRMKSQGNLPEKYIIEPFLSYLMLLSTKDTSYIFNNKAFTIHILYRREKKLWQYNITSEMAQNYLKNLIVDYLKRREFDLIPFNTIRNTINSISSNANNNIFTNIDAFAFRELFEKDLNSNEEISDLIRLSKAKVPDNVLEKVKRRHSLIFKAKDVT